MYLYVRGLPGQIHHHLFLHSDVYVQLCNSFCICSCTRLTLREMISEEQKPNSVFSLVFFGDPFDLLSDCLQTSHPSLSGMNFFFFVCFWVCSLSPSFHCLCHPFGFSVSQPWFVWRRWPRWPWRKSWRREDRITGREPSHQ